MSAAAAHQHDSRAPSSLEQEVLVEVLDCHPSAGSLWEILCCAVSGIAEFQGCPCPYGRCLNQADFGGSIWDPNNSFGLADSAA